MPSQPKFLILTGEPISGGLALGRARIHLEDPSVVPVYHLEGEADVQTEIDAFAAAMEKADEEAGSEHEWAKESLPESEAEIFAAQRAILRDPSLVQWVEDKIRGDQVNAAAAVRERFDEFRAILRDSSSEIIRNRILDVSDAERLILSHLLGQPAGRGNHGATEGPVVLVTNNPPPSLLAKVDPEQVVGIVCERGAGMGHIAVLARALNLPAVIQVEGLLAQTRDGDLLAVDGDAGSVTLNPGARDQEELHARVRRRRLLQPPVPKDPRAQRVTRDGVRILVAGNATSQREVDGAAQVDADGIGLYRTEFLYLSRPDLPDEAELAACYADAARSFVDDPVDVRLLDLGSDKHLPGLDLPAERNPALGLRSLRLLFAHPDLLRTQVRAVLQASAEGPLRLLLPMVTSADDVRRVRELVARCHEELRREGVRHDPDLPIGAMIESPAGAVLAEEILAVSDFISVGTNDLTMYLLSVDRDAAHLAPFYDPFHPAVIRTLRRLADQAAAAGKPLSVCGEVAGDPTMTGLLVGLGVQRLSMSPQWIVPVGHVLAGVDVAAWRSVADELTRLGSAEDIRRTVREVQRAG
jgi:phosphotransferase system enzyme I (PtsI)